VNRRQCAQEAKGYTVQANSRASETVLRLALNKKVVQTREAQTSHYNWAIILNGAGCSTILSQLAWVHSPTSDRLDPIDAQRWLALTQGTHGKSLIDANYDLK
jgi:hypothetical protein